MKYWRALLHYYFSQLIPGLALFFLSWTFIDLIWAMGIYILFAQVVGYLAFRSFYAEQLNFYNNLGFTTGRLLLNVFYINLVLLVVLAALVSLILWALI